MTWLTHHRVAIWIFAEQSVAKGWKVVERLEGSSWYLVVHLHFLTLKILIASGTLVLEFMPLAFDSFLYSVLSFYTRLVVAPYPPESRAYP